MGRDEDKERKAEWKHGKEYILDPLTAPEPSQETGPGSSFVNSDPLRRSTSVRNSKPTETGRQRASSSSAAGPSLPTPSTSLSPTRLSFEKSPVIAEHERLDLLPRRDRQPSTSLSRSKSLITRSSYRSPQGEENRRRPPNSNEAARAKWSEGTILNRSDSTSSRNPASPVSPRSPQSPTSTFASRNPFRDSVSPTRQPLDKGKGLRRSSSLSSRHPNDMTHRPLDMIKRDNRAADRAPHLRSRKIQVGLTDTIDSLDVTAIGGAYHHSGPYDATLAGRNTNKLYSPVEAVRDSNAEALRATPREYVQDSLVKHVPLQGTATVPPGEKDVGGRTMRYAEGADLMREPDAPGGAYRRYDFIQYLPEDLKGKGEPSYTAEERAKEQESRLKKHGLHSSGGRAPVDGSSIEMQSGVNRSQLSQRHKDGGVQVRQRSVSNVVQGSSSAVAGNGGLLSPPMSPTSPGAAGASSQSEIRRSNTTGKRFSDGLKRRLGSFRRKKVAEEAGQF